MPIHCAFYVPAATSVGRRSVGASERRSYFVPTRQIREALIQASRRGVGVFVTIGSINFDARSTHENAEASFAFYDRDLGARLEAIFAEDESHCREITYESWKRRGLDERLAELISSLFKPLY